MKLTKATFTDADGYTHCVYGSSTKQVEEVIKDAFGWGDNKNFRHWKLKRKLKFELLEFDASRKGLVEAIRVGYKNGVSSTLIDTSSHDEEQRGDTGS